jgi:hypothetical protein
MNNGRSFPVVSEKSKKAVTHLTVLTVFKSCLQQNQSIRKITAFAAVPAEKDECLSALRWRCAWQKVKS